MVPVIDDGRVYFHTGSTEVKCANIRANPHVLVLAGDTAWDRGLDIAFEGTAVPVTDDALLRRIAELYRSTLGRPMEARPSRTVRSSPRCPTPRSWSLK